MHDLAATCVQANSPNRLFHNLKPCMKKDDCLSPTNYQLTKNMTTDELLHKLLVQMTTPKLPVEVDLWDTRNICAYLKRSPDTVRDDIVTLPSFPKPIRLPVKGRAHALFKAREVIAWAESHVSR